jgi:hypothetical protein
MDLELLNILKPTIYVREQAKHLRIIQGDQTVSVRWKKLVYLNNPHTIDDLKKTITEYIRNVGRPVLNTVFENTVRPVSKCLETGGRHFEHYL